jgi:hypothetical protein
MKKYALLVFVLFAPAMIFSVNSAARQAPERIREARIGVIQKAIIHETREIVWSNSIETKSRRPATSTPAVVRKDAIIEGIYQMINEIPFPIANKRLEEIDRSLIELMIVPNLPSYEVIKEKIETDFYYRTLLGEISKTFEIQGYAVKDFAENLKINERSYQVQKELYTDPFDFLIKNAPVEVVVYVDIRIEDFGEGEKQVSLQLSAKDKYTADRYATTSLLTSTRRQWPNMHRPAEEALNRENSLTNFLQQLDENLLEIRKTGRKVDIQLESLNEEIRLDQQIRENKSLGRLITDWINTHSITGLRTNPGLSGRLFRCEAGIPVYNEQGQRYSPLDFGFALREYINSIKELKLENLELKVAGKMIYLYLK